MPKFNWLSQLLRMITVTGELQIRSSYGAPWGASREKSAGDGIPYHVVLRGRAIVEDLERGTTREVVGGDIVLFPHGEAYVLHDGSGDGPAEGTIRRSRTGWTVSENSGQGEPLGKL